MSDYKYPNPPNHTPFDREAYAALRAAYRAHYDACCCGSSEWWPYNEEATRYWMAAVDRADNATREEPGVMYGEALERERRAIADVAPRGIWVYQEGFHGAARVPIKGLRWRPWNESLVAVDLDEEAATAMHDAAACRADGCTCGGYRLALPSHDVGSPGSSGTYLVPIEWIPDGLRAELTQAAPAAS